MDREQVNRTVAALAQRSSAPNALAKCSPAWLKNFLEQLGVTFQLFRMEPDEVLVAAYQEALADLTERDITLAFTSARRHHRIFMPSPAQLRDYLRRAREDMRYSYEPPGKDCPLCSGTGWQNRLDANGKVIGVKLCRKNGGAEFHGEPPSE